MTVRNFRYVLLYKEKIVVLNIVVVKKEVFVDQLILKVATDQLLYGKYMIINQFSDEEMIGCQLMFVITTKEGSLYMDREKIIHESYAGKSGFSRCQFVSFRWRAP